MNTMATLRRPVSNAACSCAAQMRFVQRLHHVALRADALLGLDHAAVQQLGQHDAPVEQARAVLVGDAQRVAKAARGDQQRGLALALQQRVGGHRGAHLHALDVLRRHRLAGQQSQQVADAGHRRVAVLLGVVAEQLVRDQPAVGRRLPTTSVKVPPRSIQNCQRLPATAADSENAGLVINQ
jgi:hypothetical protein